MEHLFMIVLMMGKMRGTMIHVKQIIDSDVLLNPEEKKELRENLDISGIM